MERADIAVVGAGAVGLAAAARLARPDRTVVVLEAHPRYGVETSSRNSEVLHAGIHYRPGSLKARLCREGRERIYALASERGFFARKTGKLVVAVEPSETAELERILSNARECGAEGLELISGADARARVPGLAACAALWVPETGIVDSEELMRTLYKQALDGGALFMFRSPVRSVGRKDGGWVLGFGDRGEELHVRWLVNSAGLHADRLAEQAGVDVEAAGYRLHWCKGCYFRSRKELHVPLPVYPVPSSHGLGIHMTPDRTGSVRFGPDTRFVDSLDYGVDPSLAGAFHESVRRYWPGLERGDLFPDTSGIRPKLSGPEGGWRDFIIAEESGRGLPGLVDLVGIESPGLTACIAIADEVSRLIRD